MKKLPKRIWFWILSGLAVILGGCSLFHREDVTCLYGPPKLYGPPPPESPYGPEDLYGPPTTDMEPDSTFNEIEEE